MLTLLGSLLGLLGSAIPEFIKMFQDSKDKAHELKLMQFQADNAEKLKQYDLQAQQIISDAGVDTANVNLAIEAEKSISNIKSEFVQSVNEMVRPVIALGFLFIYFAIKIMAYYHAPVDTPLILIYETLWSGEDGAIFAAIISFYFGNRSLRVQRNKQN